MKNTVIILIIVSVGLGIALLARHQSASRQVKAAAAENQRLATQYEDTRQKLEEQQKVAAVLETNLTARTGELDETSKALMAVKGDWAKAQDELVRTQSELKTAQSDLRQRDTRVAQLETQTGDLTKKMDDLTGNITSLETQIADTKQKLASAEGDRDFLLKELGRLQTEKAELVRQFNDLALVRAQLAKLREEHAIAQRMDWMERGVYAHQDRKGAQVLFSKAHVYVPKSERRLNVEVRQDGAATAVETSTNAPPQKE